LVLPFNSSNGHINQRFAPILEDVSNAKPLRFGPNFLAKVA